MSSDLMPIRFLKQRGMWNAGEVACFPPADALRLVAAGIARAEPLQAAAKADQRGRGSVPATVSK